MEQYFLSESNVYTPVKSSNIRFHRNDNEYHEQEFLDTILGIIELEMKEVPVINKPIFLYFTVDRSGSMSDECKHKKTKMWHVQQTFHKMLTFIKNTPEAEVYIQVVAFDDKVKSIIDTIQITPENVDILIEKIYDIEPDGSTNIELALLAARENIQKHVDTYPNHRITHVFLTDGDITDGCVNETTLCNIVTESTEENNYRSVFIGFGEQHNYRLLNKLGDTKRGEYRFIDNGETAGIVYGEVLSRLLRPAVDDVTLTMENGGEIYDWQTNRWVKTIYEDLIDSEAKKIYHVRVINTGLGVVDLQDINVVVRGLVSTSDMNHSNNSNSVTNSVLNDIESNIKPDIIDVVCPLPPLIDMETNESTESCYSDLTKYLFRQKTMELLYLSKTARRTSITEKRGIAEFFRKMRKYARENDLLDDPLMQIMFDDLVVAYRYYGENANHIYSSARQVSQGRQYTYTPTCKKINSKYRPPTLRRSIVRCYGNDENAYNAYNGYNSYNGYNDEEQLSHMLMNIRTKLFCKQMNNENAQRCNNSDDFDAFNAKPATTFSDEDLVKQAVLEQAKTPTRCLVSEIKDDDVIVESGVKDHYQQYNNNDENDVDNIENFIYSDDAEVEDANNTLNRIVSSPYYTSNRMNTMRALSQTDSE
jgi:hypothetical protein